MGLLERLTRNKSSIDIQENAEAEKIINYALSQGVPITRDVAMKICALNNGVSLIADSISNLPIELYMEDSNGVRTIVKDYRHRILNLENSKHSTSFNMKRVLITDYILHGNAYLDIWKENGKVKSLMNIPYGDISIQSNCSYNKRERVYKYDFWGMTKDFHEVLNLVRNPSSDEIEGVGILDEGRNVLGTANGLEDYSLSTVTQGFFAKGIIEAEKIISKPTRESLSNRIKQFFSGGKNAGKVLILDDGMKFKSLSLSPVDLDLLNQKDFTVNDIARLLKIPAAMIGGSSSSMTYSNVQDTQLQFLQMTIEPYLTVVENTLNKYLLTEDEKEQGYYFEFNTRSMLRTTPRQQVEMLNRATNSKPILTINEARAEMNLPPIEGGDQIDFKEYSKLNNSNSQIEDDIDSKEKD